MSNQARCLFRVLFSILFRCFALFCISLMETWPCTLVFNIALRQLFSNTFNFLVSSCLRYHVSEPMYRRRFKFTETSLRDHTIFFNLPNALLANAILLFALSDEFGTSDHKKLNSLTISIFSF